MTIDLKKTTSGRSGGHSFMTILQIVEFSFLVATHLRRPRLLQLALKGES